MITPLRRILLEASPLYYPFGNTPSRNVLKDLNFQSGAHDVTKILLLGCGDLRNTLHSASTENVKSLHFHLNDFCPSVMARNLLILKIISANEFDPEKGEDMAFLWDLWYNSEWPEITLKRFQKVLMELLDGVLPDNIFVPKSSQLDSLMEVWTAWNSISLKSHSESKGFINEISKERQRFIIEKGCVNNRESKGQPDNSSFFKALDENVSNFEMLNMGSEYKEEKQILHEVRSYFEKGSSRLQPETDIVCVNPTMLNPTTQRWQVHYASCPFYCYPPLSQKDLDAPSDEGVLTRHCQAILKNLVASYRKRIQTIKVFFHLGDALELCYFGTTEQFDVIDCSNLADHVGLANLINATSGRLADNPEAVLFTESINWTDLAYSVEKYVEKALCSPLSLIPTVYGLKLKDHVELGASTLPNLRTLSGKPVNLCWQKTPLFRNLALSSFPAWTQSSQNLAQLVRKCFIEKPLQRQLGYAEPGDKCGMVCYSPLTFQYILSSMIQRVGGHSWLNEVNLNFPPAFNLARKTTEAWQDGKKILKFTAEIQFNTLNEAAFEKLISFIVNPMLRLVLVPKGALLNRFVGGVSLMEPFFTTLRDGSSTLLDFQFIDNLQVKISKTTDDKFEKVSISFLLLPDHGLEESIIGCVIDVATGFPIFCLDSVTSMRVENFDLPFPFKHLPLSFAKQKGMMIVDSCIESEDQYKVKILIECDKTLVSVQGLKISTNQVEPCESTHDVILSLARPGSIQPLKLSFPYPILVDEIVATLHRKDSFISLDVKKAVLEPWPLEFQPEHFKLKSDNLIPWEEKKKSLKMFGGFNSLEIHLKCQFNVFKHPHQPSLMESTLNKIREIIQFFFVDPATQNPVCFCIQRNGATSPDWYLRVHQPVLTTPTGSPILMLSAVDNRMAENLKIHDKLAKKTLLKDIERIFKETNGTKLIIWIDSPEQLRLWRYVLRLNSTRIVPTAQQKKNLLLKEDRPWMLATFISPLYADCMRVDRDYENFNRETAVVLNQCCAACHLTRQNLKRCSRCRSVFYCSVECQRGHWVQHKSVCSKN